MSVSDHSLFVKIGERRIGNMGSDNQVFFIGSLKDQTFVETDLHHCGVELMTAMERERDVCRRTDESQLAAHVFTVHHFSSACGGGALLLPSAGSLHSLMLEFPMC